ncbi:uncharacterized protein METZ01_LOCUS431737, partial [marine metagenome]
MMGFHCPFRVGHHAVDVSGLVADTCNVIDRAVRVPLIAKKYLSVCLQFGQYRFIRPVIAFSMGNGQVNRRSQFTLVKAFVRILDPEGLIKATKLDAVVPHQGTGKQTRFAKNLKPIAYSEDLAAFLHKFFQVDHDRGKPGNCTATQVITKGKSTGNDHRFSLRRQAGLMPYAL